MVVGAAVDAIGVCSVFCDVGNDGVSVPKKKPPRGQVANC